MPSDIDEFKSIAKRGGKSRVKRVKHKTDLPTMRKRKKKEGVCGVQSAYLNATARYLVRRDLDRVYVALQNLVPSETAK